MPRINFNLPDEIHQAAKLLALNQRKSLRQFIIDAIEAAIKPKKV